MIYNQRTQLTLLTRLQALRISSAPRKPIILAPYDPANEKIAAFHQSPAFIRALFGGNQSAKSESSVYDALKLATERPGSKIWLCTNTNEMLGTNIYPYVIKYLPSDAITNISWMNKARHIPALIALRDTTEISFKSYEQGREKFQGTSGVWVILHDEESPEDIFEESLARLREDLF
jgi:hypothetical protein